MPEISVVMPVLEPHPVFFREAVKSVLAQTLQDFELVIVEDPSSRTATELLAEFRDERIRHHVNGSRTSLVQQRNAGLEMARGDLVALMDADDVCEPERLAKQRDFLRHNPQIDVLGSQLAIIDDRGALIAYRRYQLEHERIAAAMRRLNPLAQPSVMLRKQCVLDAGGYQYERFAMAEDYELWCRLLQRHAKFANHPEALLRYRIHADQTKASRLREHLRATLDIKQMYWSQQNGLRSNARIWLERMLLKLPPQVVLRLFYWSQFKRTTRSPPNIATVA